MRAVPLPCKFHLPTDAVVMMAELGRVVDGGETCEEISALW